jgi:hypothetical protein
MSKRYIDADALKERLDLVSVDAVTLYEMGINAGLHRAEAEIELAPTADVVEVVRCKDCKFWGIPHANDIEKSHYCCRDNMWCMPLRFANDYCSYGERREENEG